MSHERVVKSEIKGMYTEIRREKNKWKSFYTHFQKCNFKGWKLVFHFLVDNMNGLIWLNVNIYSKSQYVSNLHAN